MMFLQMNPCHLIPDDFHALTADVKDILTSFSNKRMPMLFYTDNLNLEVASWVPPSHNVTTSVSSLLLEDNVGKDGFSSQSTYKDNIQDFDAPGMVVTSLLKHCQPPTPLLTNIYGAIMKVLNEMRVQITVNAAVPYRGCILIPLRPVISRLVIGQSASRQTTIRVAGL
jgi:hypothetical protein